MKYYEIFAGFSVGTIFRLGNIFPEFEKGCALSKRWLLYNQAKPEQFMRSLKKTT